MGHHPVFLWEYLPLGSQTCTVNSTPEVKEPELDAPLIGEPKILKVGATPSGLRFRQPEPYLRANTITESSLCCWKGLSISPINSQDAVNSFYIEARPKPNAATMSVHALSLSETHTFSKQLVPFLTLLPGLGIEGDCHCGETVQHRSRLHIRPKPKNLRQVHLLDLEILEEFDVKPGDLGENVTAVGVGLLGLARGARLHFLPALDAEDPEAGGAANGSKDTSKVESGSEQDPALLKTAKHPILVVTGLRNPCSQISRFRAGLQEQFIVRDEERKIIARRAGVMSTVEVGGVIDLGMRIIVEPPAKWEPLECV
jgi:hypothetical protein